MLLLLLLFPTIVGFLLHRTAEGFAVPTSQQQRFHALVRSSSSSSSGENEVVPKSSVGVPLSSSSKEEDLSSKITAEAKEIFDCVSIISQSLFQSNVEATDIVQCCDELDKLLAAADVDDDVEMVVDNTADELVVSRKILNLRRRALEFRRYTLLAKLLGRDYSAYVATASFLSPSRIPRMELPNVQDIPYTKEQEEKVPFLAMDENGIPLVADCDLADMEYKDNPLDKLLLKIFRGLVTGHTGGVTSEKPGIEGLLEQGRTFMLQPGQTPEAQHQMVYNTLKSLMTPVLPPFYRIFMSGIVPKINTPFDGKQLGPWFYAPYLTSFVTPVFFAFLVGPSRPNRRRDGAPGGLVVEKCKFLQESGCKGLCLHQCKLPAQKFFAQELGLPLTVTPNFATQECQWSFGETPLPPSQDPAFPGGCLAGCPSRKLWNEAAAVVGRSDDARKVDLCNYSM